MTSSKTDNDSKLKDEQILFLHLRSFYICSVWREISSQQPSVNWRQSGVSSTPPPPTHLLPPSLPPSPRLPLCSHLHDETEGEELCRRCRGEIKSAGGRVGTFGSTLVFHSLPLISQYSMAVDGGLFIDLLDD